MKHRECKLGRASILLILGFLIFIGLGVLLFVKDDAQSENANKVENTSKQIAKKLTPEEKEKQKKFKKHLDMYKDTVIKLEQKDLKLFKEQTNMAFNQLSVLIAMAAEYIPTKDMDADTVKDLAKAIKEESESIVKIEDEDEKEIVSELRKCFNASKIAISGITAKCKCKARPTKEEKEKCKCHEECKCSEKKLEKIEEKIEELNEENYKPVSREIFLQFYSAIKCMYSCPHRKSTESTAEKQVNNDNLFVKNNLDFLNAEKNQNKIMEQFKDHIVKIDVKDQKVFKQQLKVSLNKLADILYYVSKNSENVSEEMEDIIEDTNKIRRNAEQLSLLDKDDKISALVKEGFKNTDEVIQEIKEEAFDCDDIDEKTKTENKKICDELQKKCTDITNKVNRIDSKNYKVQTKEILMDVHSLIEYLNKEIQKTETA